MIRIFDKVRTVDIVMLHWLGAYVLSLIMFVYSMYILYVMKNGKKRMAQAIICSFIANWLLYIPCELFGNNKYANQLIMIIEGISTSFLKSLNIYLGNGYERAYIDNYPIFSGLYSILRVIVNIELLLLVAGIVIDQLSDSIQKFKFLFFKRNDMFVFSQLNEKTMTIAETIIKDYIGNGKKKKICLIFSCDQSELDLSKQDFIKRVNGICLTDQVEKIILDAGEFSRPIEIFLFENSEECNLIQLSNICKSIRRESKCNVKIYVELKSLSWNLYNGFLHNFGFEENHNVIVNFVNAEENFAYNLLFADSIFCNAKSNEELVLNINVMIVGMNERNLEILKAILHLSQMPGYRLSILIIDPNNNWDKIQMMMPEINNEYNLEGDAIYTIDYRDNVKIDSLAIERIIDSQFRDFTYAFINVGNDIENLKIANRINIYCKRNRFTNRKIRVNISHPEVFQYMNKNLHQGIEFVGAIEKIYSYNFLTNSLIERASASIHNIRHKEDNTSWIAYCNNEYKRHSVYARTLSLKHKISIINELYEANFELLSKDKKWMSYEHMRWNVYTRTLGCVLADNSLLNSQGTLDKKVREEYLVHDDLISYDCLSDEKKNNDSIEISAEILEIFAKLSEEG